MGCDASDSIELFVDLSSKQQMNRGKHRVREENDMFADSVKTWGRVVETGKQRGNGEGEQGTGLTYMRWEGLQGRDTLFWVGSFPFGEIGLQAWAGLIHRHGPTGPRRLPAFQGWGAGGVRVVCTAGDLIDIGSDLPLEGRVLALQRLQLEETVSNTLRGALSKARRVAGSDLLKLTAKSFRHFLCRAALKLCYCQQWSY